MSYDIFTSFDNASHQYNIGNYGAWHQFMARMREKGIKMILISGEVWCANGCIMLPDEGVDDTEEL
jgi:hypothetical protein